MTPQDLERRVEQRIAERRHEKAQYFASLLFLLEIPSNHLDLNSDFEWFELQRAAETDGKTYGVPNSETRLMILALLREYECRAGRKPIAKITLPCDERRVI